MGIPPAPRKPKAPVNFGFSLSLSRLKILEDTIVFEAPVSVVKTTGVSSTVPSMYRPSP
ncbi:hypothetical protein DPMN_041106 [Dreissena polymorpha]|uniref:Uncharacterized protein n=1 Tax=Dreissena polymorpha TaxID=45954 RepID=A0A9D4HXK4_DREPO|nr:hypothetical protein DPMN_041106 [Dreissena polymorpha]